VKNQGNKLMTFRAFSIGFSTALLALACGSEDANNGTPVSGSEVPVTPAPPVVLPAEETCADNQFLAGCPDTTGNVPPAVDNTPPGGGGDVGALAKAAAENVLLANCGQCHGSQLDAEDIEAGMNYIDDIDKLVEEGKIFPLDADNSEIIDRMRLGEMPPSYSGLPPVSDNDIEIVAQYINNEQFWPDVAPRGGDCTDTNETIDFDQLFDIINDDLSGEDADDQINYRYIVLTNRFNAGVCADTSLDRDRQAINKLVNALSIDPSLTEPQEIDPDRTVYRIDLRDYQWDRAINVEGTDFVDVWEAIADANPYAVPFVGDDADDAVADTGTAFPFMFADSMLDSASIGNLYYAIVDVDVNATIDDFILNELQIDVAANLLESELVRAGTTKSRISRQDRVVERHDIGVRNGAFWQSFDFADDQNESIFENPFAFNEGGREAIFTLPNGLLGFIIADENGLIVEDSDILLDTNQNNFRAITSVSCNQCHFAGFIPVVDEVAPVSLANAIGLELDRDEIEQLQDVYPEAAEFAQIVADDSSQFYQNALTRLNLPARGADQISGIFLQFDRDMRLRDAAGDLGLSPDVLESNLNELEAEVQVLETGTLDRDDFTQFYVNSLCLLSVVLDNQPDVAVCDAAQAEIDAL